MPKANQAIDAQVELLEAGLKQEKSKYEELAKKIDTGMWAGGRMRLQSWLGEIAVLLSQFEQQVAQLRGQPHPAPRKLDSAWRIYRNILGALAPDDPATISWRLVVVSTCLYVQIAIAAVLVVYTAYVFRYFDPQTNLTRTQWDERQSAAAEIQRVANHLEAAARDVRESAARPAPASAATPVKSAAPTGTGTGQAAAAEPETSAAAGTDLIGARDEVEALVAKLGEMKLSPGDARLVKTRIDSALSEFDREQPRLADAAEVLRDLGATFVHERRPPPSLIRLVILGSVLGMITITIHTNWKYRNHWNTVGFIGWYATKLVGAPVISLAAIGLLMQVSFSSDLSAGAGISSLGLKDAQPLLIFSVAILTGLFSNKVFDWLRRLATAQTGTSRQDAATTRTTAAGAGTDEDNQAANE